MSGSPLCLQALLRLLQGCRVCSLAQYITVMIMMQHGSSHLSAADMPPPSRKKRPEVLLLLNCG
jgi:hypothetical protein